MVSSLCELYRGENAYILLYIFTIHCDIAKPELRDKTGVSAENQMDESKKSGDSFTLDTESLPFNSQTKRNIEILFNHFSKGFVFSRKDIKELCNLTDSPAGDLINKMKKANLITEAKDRGRGKYKFLGLQDQ